MRAPHPWLGHPNLQKKNWYDFLSPLFFLFTLMGSLCMLAGSQMQLRSGLTMTRRSKISTRVKRGLPTSLFKIGMAQDITGSSDVGLTLVETMTFDSNILLKSISRPVSNARTCSARVYDTTTGLLVGSGPAISCVTGWNELPLTTPVLLVSGRAYRIGFYTTGGNGQVTMGNHPNAGNVLTADGVTVTIDAFNGRYYFSGDGYPTSAWAGGGRTFTMYAEAYKTLSFAYTGAAQTVTVPDGANSMIVDIYGAEGGHGDSSASGAGGGRVQATLPVTAGETLQLNVGQKGGDASSTPSFNGGGAGGGSGTPKGGSGGGATDIRRGAFSLADRIVVAGGGGGNYSNSTVSNGGVGGGLTGGAGIGSNGVNTRAGAGGTQSAGGIGGVGGAYGAGGAGTLGVGGDATGNSVKGGGGGGGYYGGGGGTGDTSFITGGGGGGSSYADPYSNAVTHTQGVRTGHGLAVITFLPSLSFASGPTELYSDGSLANTYLNVPWTGNFPSGKFTLEWHGILTNVLLAQRLLFRNANFNLSVTALGRVSVSWTGTTASRSATSSVAHKYAAGQVAHFQVRVDPVGNGSVGTASFWQLSDDGMTWEQLGTPSASSGSVTLQTSIDDVLINASASSDTTRLIGVTKGFRIYDGNLGEGAPIIEADFSRQKDSSLTTVTASTGQVVTINGATGWFQPDDVKMTHLTAGAVGLVSANTYTLPAVQPTANRLLLLHLHYKANGPAAGASRAPVSITGCGLTWQLVKRVGVIANDTEALVYRAMGPSPTNAAITITLDVDVTSIGVINWQLSEFSNVSLSGTDGSGAVVQAVSAQDFAATALGVTLAAFESPRNATVLFPATNAAPSLPSKFISKASAEFNTGTVSQDTGIRTSIRAIAVTNPSISFGSNKYKSLIAVELRRAV